MKVKLPREVADAVETLKLSCGTRGILEGVLGNANTRPFEILKKYVEPVGGFSVLLEVLVIGYEVEETPEDKAALFLKQWGFDRTDSERIYKKIIDISKGVND